MNLARQEHGPHAFKMTAALAAIVPETAPDQPPFRLHGVAAARPKLAAGEKAGEKGGNRP